MLIFFNDEKMHCLCRFFPPPSNIVQENFYVKTEASEMSGAKEYDYAMATH